MAKTIVQKIIFKNTSPATLYNLYMNAKLHAAVTGEPAKITCKPGAFFSAYGTYISGKNVFLAKDRLIVQTWRAEDWNPRTPDSIFIINIEPKKNDTILHMVHTNLPDKAAREIGTGWHEFYWKPWKQYLQGKI